MKKLVGVLVVILCCLGLVGGSLVCFAESIEDPFKIDNILEVSSGDLFAKSMHGIVTMKIGVGKAIVNGDVRLLRDNSKFYAPFLKDNRTYVPVRFITECLGWKVDWEGLNKIVTISNNTDEVKFRIGYSEYSVNGNVLSMDAEALLSDSKTYIPVRFLAEALGKQVHYKSGVVVIGDRNLKNSQYEFVNKIFAVEDDREIYMHEPIIGTEVGRSNMRWDMVIHEDKAYYINRIGDARGQVYETCVDSNGDIDWAGGSTALPTDYSCQELSLYNGVLYFRTEKKIQGYDIKTKKVFTVLDSPVASIMVTGEGIYYIPSKYSYSGTAQWVGNGINLLHFDGTVEYISEIKSISYLSYFLGKLYYVKETQGVSALGVFDLRTRVVDTTLGTLEGVVQFSILKNKLYVINQSESLSFNREHVAEGATLSVNLLDYSDYEVFEGNRLKYIESKGELYGYINKSNGVTTDVFIFKVDLKNKSCVQIAHEVNSSIVYIGDSGSVYLQTLTTNTRNIATIKRKSYGDW